MVKTTNDPLAKIKAFFLNNMTTTTDNQNSGFTREIRECPSDICCNHERQQPGKFGNIRVATKKNSQAMIVEYGQYLECGQMKLIQVYVNIYVKIYIYPKYTWLIIFSLFLPCSCIQIYTDTLYACIFSVIFGAVEHHIYFNIVTIIISVIIIIVLYPRPTSPLLRYCCTTSSLHCCNINSNAASNSGIFRISNLAPSRK